MDRDELMRREAACDRLIDRERESAGPDYDSGVQPASTPKLLTRGPEKRTQ